MEDSDDSVDGSVAMAEEEDSSSASNSSSNSKGNWEECSQKEDEELDFSKFPELSKILVKDGSQEQNQAGASLSQETAVSDDDGQNSGVGPDCVDSQATEASAGSFYLDPKNVEIRTVPEDEDLFGTDAEYTLQPPTDSFGELSLSASHTPGAANSTPYHSGHSDSEESESSYSSYSSGSYESISYDEDDEEVEIINEDWEELARDTYPVKVRTLPSKDTPDSVRETVPVKKPSKPVKPAKVSKTAQRARELLLRLEKSKEVTNRWLKDLELPENLSMDVPVNIPIVDMNPYLTCGLCFGYLYEASTITECMHTFCKNCIVRHCMEVSLHCPTCNILIHPTDPFVHIRLDRMIQDIVDKILPAVPVEELRRIKEFYAAHPEAEPKEIKQAVKQPVKEPVKPKVKTPPKQPVEPKPPAVPGPLVSVLLEHEGGDDDFNEPLEGKYLRVDGSATVTSMAKFLKKRLNLQETSMVDIFCCGDTLEEDDSTILSIKEKFFSLEEECLMLLQYKVRDQQQIECF